MCTFSLESEKIKHLVEKIEKSPKVVFFFFLFIEKKFFLILFYF